MLNMYCFLKHVQMDISGSTAVNHAHIPPMEKDAYKIVPVTMKHVISWADVPLGMASEYNNGLYI